MCPLSTIPMRILLDFVCLAFFGSGNYYPLTNYGGTFSEQLVFLQSNKMNQCDCFECISCTFSIFNQSSKRDLEKHVDFTNTKPTVWNVRMIALIPLFKNFIPVQALRELDQMRARYESAEVARKALSEKYGNVLEGYDETLSSPLRRLNLTVTPVRL